MVFFQETENTGMSVPAFLTPNPEMVLRNRYFEFI